MAERREFTRVPAETHVKISSVPEGEMQEGTGKNIGGGGILFSSETSYEPGTLLDIEVLTAAHQAFAHAFDPLRARIRVIRVEPGQPPYDVAAEFVQMGG
jgi:hypothetical protein